ncbi:MAG: hypothetical protein DBW74_03435 [Cryomorphaceae bacterium]|nr:MAG: hypothetical protein DBW74_03435 [Cryomorphaceae bacterium]
MEKIKYSIALILITSSTLSQSDDVINSRLIKMEKIADSLVQLCEFEKPIELYRDLVNSKPNNFNYNYKLAATLAAKIEIMPRIRGAAYVPEMLNQLEKTYGLDNSSLSLNWIMLQVYLEVPGFLGGGKKKARKIIENISKISENEGKKALNVYENFPNIKF